VSTLATMMNTEDGGTRNLPRTSRVEQQVDSCAVSTEGGGGGK
jgi:hypothetical protein